MFSNSVTIFSIIPILLLNTLSDFYNFSDIVCFTYKMFI